MVIEVDPKHQAEMDALAARVVCPNCKAVGLRKKGTFVSGTVNARKLLNYQCKSCYRIYPESKLTGLDVVTSPNRLNTTPPTPATPETPQIVTPAADVVFNPDEEFISVIIGEIKRVLKEKGGRDFVQCTTYEGLKNYKPVKKGRWPDKPPVKDLLCDKCGAETLKRKEIKRGKKQIYRCTTCNHEVHNPVKKGVKVNV